MRLPLHLDMEGKRVLVVGLGEVGKRRVEKLLVAGAEVTAIDRKKVKSAKGVKFIRKILGSKNLPSFKGYFLVVAATDDPVLNAAISKRAKADGCLVNRADSHGDGNVIFPAVVETNVGVFSFSTGGKNPRLSKRVKEAIESELSES